MKKLQFKTITKTQLADTITPVSLYLKIRDKYANSLLLESSDYHSKENSYSFLCVEPLVTIKAEDNKMSVSYKNNRIDTANIDRNFYSKFEEYSNLIAVDCLNNIDYFNGLYGYTTFDAVQYFETIKLKTKKAVSSIPMLQYSFYRFIIAINHFKNEMILIENIPEGENSRLNEIKYLVNSQSFAQYTYVSQGKETSNITDDEFKENVAKAKEHCKRGDVFQLVLSRQFQQKFKGDEFNVYRALRAINPSPYLFYFDYGSFKLMGSSPEAQLKIENKKAIINPIAGTFRRTGDTVKDTQLAKDLANDPKENAEHIMLVDLARNDLSKHSNNVTVKTYKEVQYFSHVIHLVSTVEGDTTGKSIEIMGDTFPAGTLSGAPKYKAIELIDKYENQTRGFYGGCVGFIGLNGAVNQAIAIRSFVSKNNTLYYQAGAGIVINSKEKSELQEVNNKLAALKKALVLAENI